MIKSELIQKIAEKNPHLYHRDVERIINTIFDQIITAMKSGDRVELRGFGAFSVKSRQGRAGPQSAHRRACDGRAQARALLQDRQGIARAAEPQRAVTFRRVINWAIGLPIAIVIDSLLRRQSTVDRGLLRSVLAGKPLCHHGYAALGAVLLRHILRHGRRLDRLLVRPGQMAPCREGCAHRTAAAPRLKPSA